MTGRVPASQSAPPVALVSFADPSGSGGVPTTIRSLTAGLTARGHTVNVFTQPLAAGVRNTPLRRIWRRIDRSSEEVRRIRRALGRLDRAVRGTTPGTVCVAFESWTAAVCAATGRRTVYRVAGLGSMTDEWIRNGFVVASSRHVPWLRDLERMGFEQATRVVALSAAGRDAIAGLGGGPEQVVVIPNGVALSPLVERAAVPTPLRILCVANLRHVKGVDVLAQALAGLPEALRQRVALTHIGSGSVSGNATFEAARDELMRAGVAHEFRGALAHTDTLRAYADAHLFVLPSRVEMFPNALLEAMASGLPAIGTGVGAVPEILGERAARDGLIPAAGDADALRTALARVISDPVLRAVHAAANRARVESEYSATVTLDRYAELVRRAAE